MTRKQEQREAREERLAKTKKQVQLKMDDIISKAQNELEQEGEEFTEEAIIRRVLSRNTKV